MSKPNTSGFGLGSKKTALSGHAKAQESAMESNYNAAKGKPSVGIPASTKFSTKIENKPANRHPLGRVSGGK